MKNLRIENASMCVRVEYDFSLLNDMLTLTCGYQCFTYRNKNGELDSDVDFVDVENIKFMGQDIEEGYRPYQNWKANMLKIGIDIEKITNEECYNDKVVIKIKKHLEKTYQYNYFGK
jgi:hypothetical protein